MIFKSIEVVGAYEISLNVITDDRGFFARFGCEKEFGDKNLNSNFVQMNTAFTAEPGTVRGLHYQKAPFEENKLMKCVAGEIFDVIIDLRKDSPSFKKWFGVTLSAVKRNMLYIPAGCAHGYQSLKPNSEVIYLSTNFYSPDHERGIRFDDLEFNINWPIPPSKISLKDMYIKDFSEQDFI
jgi:dTDP-4-dehydrorhamnose 3,5-epimerase